MLSMEDAAEKLSTESHLRAYQPGGGKKKREDGPAANSIYDFDPEDDGETAAVVIGARPPDASEFA